jgi:hypothetical protein
MATALRSVPVNATSGPLDRRLHDIGWWPLLMLTGVIWLVPAEHVPEGAWLLGVAALVAAFSRIWLTDLPVLAIGLLVIGASLVGQAPSDEDHVTATAGGHP